MFHTFLKIMKEFRSQSLRNEHASGGCKFLQFLFAIPVALILHQIVNHSVLVPHCTLRFFPFSIVIVYYIYGVFFGETCRKLCLN